MAFIDASSAGHGTSELDSTGGAGSFAASTNWARRFALNSRSWRVQVTGQAAFGTMTLLSAGLARSVSAIVKVDDVSGLGPFGRVISLASGTNRLFVAVSLSAGGKAQFSVHKTDGVMTTLLIGATEFGEFEFGSEIQIVLRSTVDTGVGAADAITAKIGGIEKTASNNWASANITAVVLGCEANADETLDFFIDDVLVESADTDISDQWFATYYGPTSDEVAEWGTVGAGASHFGRMSDNNTGTGVRASGAAQVREQYGLTDYPAMRIGLVDRLLLSVWHGDLGDTVAFTLSHVCRNSAVTSATINASTVAALQRSAVASTTVELGKKITSGDLNPSKIQLFKGAQGATNQCTALETFAYAIHKRRPRWTGK